MAFFRNLSKKISSFTKTKRARWVLGVVAILLLLLIIRSCSGRGVLESHVFHIAKPVNWSPVQLSGKEDNLQAFINELISKVAQEEHIQADIITFRTGDLFKRLDDDEYDGILQTVLMEPFLKERYAVSDSIFLAGPVLVVPEGSSVTSLEQLKGRPIGISKDSPLSFRMASQHPDMMLISYDNIITALNDADSHSIAGVILEAQLAYTYTQALFSGKLKVATAPLIDLGIRLIARKDSHGEHLIEHFNAGLAKIKEDGDYDSLLQRWELISPK